MYRGYVGERGGEGVIPLTLNLYRIIPENGGDMIELRKEAKYEIHHKCQYSWYGLISNELQNSYYEDDIILSGEQLIELLCDLMDPRQYKGLENIRINEALGYISFDYLNEYTGDTDTDYFWIKEVEDVVFRTT